MVFFEARLNERGSTENHANVLSFDQNERPRPDLVSSEWNDVGGEFMLVGQSPGVIGEDCEVTLMW